MRPSIPLLIALLAPASAGAQESQLKKADAAFAAYRDGDSAALEAARTAIDKASAHKKTSSKGSVWVLKGRVYTELALQDSVPTAAAVMTAVEAWEGAAERDASKDAIAEELVKLLSATTLIVRDDLESKRIDEAWQRIEAAMKGRDLLERKGWSDPRIEAPLLQFAILTAVRAKKLDQAKLWFTDWRAMDAFEPSVAAQVAAGIASAEGAEAGVAFLEPMLQQRPLDPVMLTRAVEILLEADQRDAARIRIAKASKSKDAESAGSALLLGHLYRAVEEPALARASFERALERNPAAAEAWLPLAELLVADAEAAAEKIRGGGLRSSERRGLEAGRKADLASAVSLVEQARDATGGTPGPKVLEGMVLVYGAAGMDAEKAEAEKALQSAP